MFIQLLVDSGRDPVVIFRVVEDGELDEQKAFVRKMEIVCVPDGHVIEQIEEAGTDQVHRVLATLIEKGIVK